LLGTDLDDTARIIFNARFGTYCVAVASLAYVAWLAYTAPRPVKDATPRTLQFVDFIQWRIIAAVAIVAVNVFTLIAVSLEIHTYWAVRRVPEFMYEQFSYSIWWMLFGAILLAVGFWKRTAFIRWQALLLLALSIGKVFLFDMSELNQGYRILSFLGLGALLLGVSYAYQRDWLGLRTEKAPASTDEGKRA
jgi:uncharacterized membrane protein